MDFPNIRRVTGELVKWFTPDAPELTLDDFNALPHHKKLQMDAQQSVWSHTIAVPKQKPRSAPVWAYEKLLKEGFVEYSEINNKAKGGFNVNDQRCAVLRAVNKLRSEGHSVYDVMIKPTGGKPFKRWILEK